MFSELAPEESETILYLLPWLLSINQPECPGYIPDIKRPFRVYNIDSNKEIRKLEKDFKGMFGVQRNGTLLRLDSEYYLIQGLYTIGSVGSVSQTSISDCDIWVCIEKDEFDELAWVQINQKINLIKDWMDESLKMPVYFFVSDVAAIRECRFGNLDSESSGSTQKNVLKEEFYRTCMVICGKLPLWWLCYDKNIGIDYADALSVTDDEDFWEYDLIDFGDIEKIEKEEYFGAALWQFHKSLSHPLKSIIKIALLQMLLNARHDRLLCHQLREEVLTTRKDMLFPDHSVFTVTSILNNCWESRKDLFNFLIDCFYMRCEVRPYDKKQELKNRFIRAFLKKYSIDRERQVWLQKYNSWNFGAQIELGNRLFRLLLQTYREIAADHIGVVSESDKRDLTILGRKISAFYMKKRYKIPILQKPIGLLNISKLGLWLNDELWQVFADNDMTFPVVSNKNVIYDIAFLVWNNLFVPNMIHMRPNSSSITLQEVINLGTRMKDFFGTYDSLDMELSAYLRKEHITKLLVVLDFERSPWYKDNMAFVTVYSNCWGEIFSRAFNEYDDFKEFLIGCYKANGNMESSFYVQRNTTSYEKIIERTKRIILSSIGT